MSPDDARARLRRSLWATVTFLLAFAALITIIARSFLLPALVAARDASASEKRQLSAYAMLLMAVVLLIVIVGIIVTFRIHRFFLPIQTKPRVHTKYVDAWAESARRVGDVPPDDPDR